MKKHLKWIIPVLCIALAISGGIYHYNSNRTPTEIRYFHTDYAINTGDLREVVGSQNYVFVGYVTETHDYFTEKNSREFPEKLEEFNTPITECVVKIIKPIKGDLKAGETFSFFKGGGVSENLKYISLGEGDFVPESGKYYVFCGFAHADGTMTGGGPNGTAELEAGINESNLAESSVYKKYDDAYKNQITWKGFYPDYLAAADVNYGDGSINRELEANAVIEKAERDRKYALEHPQYALEHPEYAIVDSESVK